MGVFPSVYFLRSSVSQALFGQISLKKGHGLFEKKKKKLARCHELFVNNGVEGMRICQGVNANIYTKKSWNP